MSIPVKLDDLAAAVRDRPYGYLVTVTDDGRPHAVTVTPAVDADGLHVTRPGRRTRANCGARPRVTLLFPPAEAGGYSLIVDGDARGGDPADGDDAVHVLPTSAVLHRPASEGSGPSSTGCAADCAPVPVER